MGALVNGQCFNTTAQAVDAYYGSAQPAYTAGATSYLGEFVWTGTAWQIKRYSIASNGAVTTLTASAAPNPTFPTCDPTSSFFDGVTIGWGVAGAMIAAWLIKNMRRGL